MVFRWRILLQSLAVLRNVEAFQFMFAGDPQRHEGRDQFKQHVGHAAGPYQGDRDTVELDQ